MDIFNKVKGAADTLVDTVSTVAQNYVEKTRTKAKLNRLRMVMKNESELMNRAYIALGKDYYAFLKTGKAQPDDRRQKLISVIDSSKTKIAKARDCYRKILENQTDMLYTGTVQPQTFEGDAVEDITVACSNESDYPTSPFEETAKPEVSAADTDDNKDDEAPADELF